MENDRKAKLAQMVFERFVSSSCTGKPKRRRAHCKEIRENLWDLYYWHSQVKLCLCCAFMANILSVFLPLDMGKRVFPNHTSLYLHLLVSLVVLLCVLWFSKMGSFFFFFIYHQRSIWTKLLPCGYVRWNHHLAHSIALILSPILSNKVKNFE